MPIGSTRIGVLGGKAIVPGGSSTFNSPGTFTVPTGVTKVNITGKGATGSAGNSGNSGNDGGGGSGGASGFRFSQVACCGTFPRFIGRFGGGAGGGPAPTRAAAPCAPNCQCIIPAPTGIPAVKNGNAGNAGTAGSAGNSGNTGTSSTGLGRNFAGGSGGNGGTAGNGGTGGNGGGGGASINGPVPIPATPSLNPIAPSYSPAPANSGGAGGTCGGGSGQSNVNCPTPGCSPPTRSVRGGGGAGTTNSGASGAGPNNSGTAGAGGTCGGGNGGYYIGGANPWQGPPNAIFGWGSSGSPNVRRAGGGGGGSNQALPYGKYAGAGGGGGRGNAGNAGNPGNAGAAANPSTFNCESVTPGASYPITVGSPGGQVVISWNPQ